MKFNFIATCIGSVESILRREVEMLGGENVSASDKLISFSGDEHTLIKSNLWLRTANRVHIELARGKVDTFDTLFTLIQSINWRFFRQENEPINIHATSVRSTLSNTPTIQSVGKKAIMNIFSEEGEGVWEDESKFPLEITLLIINDEARILLNTSGDALHKRGYRISGGEAPLKESLAAALILLSGWKFKAPLYDLFCGSGTILIEAAMIAKNIAPGRNRRFAFEAWKWLDMNILTQAKKEAETKVFQKNYTLTGYDLDPNSILLSQENAKSAGVDDVIRFEKGDALSVLPKHGHIVSNPPYGKRLKTENIDFLYETLTQHMISESALTGGMITLYPDFDHFFHRSHWKMSKIKNGAETCGFYRKIVG